MNKKIIGLALFALLIPNVSFASDAEIRSSIIQSLLSQFVAQVNAIDSMQQQVALAQDQSQFASFKDLLQKQLDFTTKQVASVLNPQQQIQTTPVFGSVTPITNNPQIPMQTVTMSETNPNHAGDTSPWFNLSSDKPFTIKKLVFQVDKTYNPEGYTLASIVLQALDRKDVESFNLSGNTNNGKITLTGNALVKDNSYNMRVGFGREGSATPEAEAKGFKVTLLGSESIILGQDGSQLSITDLVLTGK